MKIFPAKILLFGEYTLLYNQKAIAIPFTRYSGRWSFENNASKSPSLTPWLKYIIGKATSLRWINQKAIDNFALDIQLGIWFDSNIPLGYGLGSSGALVAAWYHRYVEEDSQKSLAALQGRLAILESFFHGSSSGFDPLVSYCNRAIYLNGNEKRIIDIEKKAQLLSSFFIVDTLQERSTRPLVNYFKAQVEKMAFRKAVLEPLIDSQEKAMEIFMAYQDSTSSSKKKRKEFEECFDSINDLQGKHLKELIPDGIQKIWKKEGLGKSRLKICGAGGGGVMLGFGELPKTQLPVIRLSFH